MEVLKADFAEIGTEDVYRKLAKDLDYRADEQTIRAKMSEFLAQAKAQLCERVRAEANPRKQIPVPGARQPGDASTEIVQRSSHRRGCPGRR